MSQEVNHMLVNAAHSLQRGDHELAEHLVQSVLSAQPKNFDALQLMGVISGIKQNHVDAKLYFKKALKINAENNFIHFNLAKSLTELGADAESLPHHVKATQLAPEHKDAWLNYGRTLHKIGEVKKALYCFDKALALDTNYADALINKALALHGMNDSEQALSLVDQALKTYPDFQAGWLNKGCILIGLKDFASAISQFDKAIALNSQYAEAWANKAIALQCLNRNEEALLVYEKVLKLQPIHQDALIGKALTLSAMQRNSDALEIIDKALEINPKNIDALLHKGDFLLALQVFEGALITFGSALKLEKKCKQAYLGSGLALLNLNRYDESLFAFQKAIKIDPEYADAHYGAAHVLLNQFNFKKGWSEYEWRFKAQGFQKLNINISKPRWMGDKSDKSILVWGEQGIGDQILYLSMINNLNCYPNNFTVAIDGRLISILERSFPNLIFVDRSSVHNDAAFDEQIPIASLGALFRSNIEEFSQFAPYVKAKDDVNNIYYPSSQGKKIICGISWKSLNNIYFDVKSIKGKLFSKIFEDFDVEIVSLQYGDVTGDIEEMGVNKNSFVTDRIDLFNDIESLVSLIDFCDVIVTVSNVTAHVAGAMGKDVFLLLPYSEGKFWYWEDNHGISLWYPSVKCFKQKTKGDWMGPINEIRKHLESRIG